MREVHIIKVVVSVINSTFREGSNAGGMSTFLTGREKGDAPYNPT